MDGFTAEWLYCIRVLCAYYHYCRQTAVLYQSAVCLSSLLQTDGYTVSECCVLIITIADRRLYCITVLCAYHHHCRQTAVLYQSAVCLSSLLQTDCCTVSQCCVLIITIADKRLYCITVLCAYHQYCRQTMAKLKLYCRPSGRRRFGRALKRLLDQTETGLVMPNW